MVASVLGKTRFYGLGFCASLCCVFDVASLQALRRLCVVL